ncbi:MAG TPA: thioredoxin family protein [Ktedonobacteraceae bacterium]|jgi:uncharacterized membrane protein
MPSALVRPGILLLLILLMAACIQIGRLMVAHQRRLALAAEPPEGLPAGKKVRILAFSSADCTQCHTLQQPALRRLQTLRGSEIDILEIDAPLWPDLARHYHILTVPSTVILGLSGEALAINYGFASFEKLQTQIAAALPPVSLP